MQEKKVPNRTSKNTSKVIKPNKPPINKSAGISYLNIIALGLNSYNIAQNLTALIANHHCNIITNNITELNQDMAFSAFISGKWHNIIKLERSLMLLMKKYPIHIYSTRNLAATNNSITEEKPYINYLIQTTTIDKPGILDKLLQFFNQENIKLKEAKVTSHAYNQSLVDIEIQIKISAEVHIVSFRENFLTYCDELNLDASLEPVS